jgi:WD40 repeat protein
MQEICKVPAEHEVFQLFVLPTSGEHILCAVAKDVEEKHIYIYDVMKGTVLYRLQNHCEYNTEPIYTVVFSFASSQSMFALGMSSGVIQLFDGKDQFSSCTKLTYHNDMVQSMEFSPNGKLLASLAFSRDLTLYNTQDHTRRTIGSIHAYNFCRVVWSVDSTLIVSWSMDGIVEIHNVVEDKPPMKIENSCEVVAAHFTQLAGMNVLAFADVDGNIKLWNQHTNEVSTGMEHDGSFAYFFRNLTFFDEGKKLLSITNRGQIRVWDTTTKKPIFSALFVAYTNFVYFRNPFEYILHPNGQQIVYRREMSNSPGTPTISICIKPICHWSDRTHHLFGGDLRRIIFQLMCIKNRQDKTSSRRGIRLPMQLWLNVFQELSYTIKD